MPKEFNIISEFIGYFTKADKTNVSELALVEGSQNVLINDAKKIETRGGYSLLGAADSSLNAIESSFDWQHSRNGEINLRTYDDKIEVYTSDLGAWKELNDGYSAVDFSFTTWWDTSENIDVLLFVNGDSNLYEWSGGIAELKSAQANELTKTGTETWANARFYTTGSKTIINVRTGTEFDYTGGEGTTTLTGVTPDPDDVAQDVQAGDIFIQKIVTHSNTPASGFDNDIISSLNNQVYVGSHDSTEVYVSADDDFTDYTFSSPRVPGEGNLLTLDGITRAFARQEDVMFIAAGKDYWYRTEFEQLDVGGTLTETMKVRRLKTTGAGQAAQSEGLVEELGNYVAFVSFEPAMYLLGNVENIEEIHLQKISDPIKSDFDDEDFTNGHIKAHEDRIYISAPANDKLYINETMETPEGMTRFWQPPQILPVRRLAVINNEIHGHSDSVPETYELFDGTDDNGNSFEAIAAFSYWNYGDRANLKTFDEFYAEGYITSNTELDITLNYDFGGYTQQLGKAIDGNDDSIIFESIEGGPLGTEPFGGAPLGDQEEEGTTMPKFKVIKDITPQDFFELQVQFSTNEVDAQWEILSLGTNARASKNQPIPIKQ